MYIKAYSGAIDQHDFKLRNLFVFVLIIRCTVDETSSQLIREPSGLLLTLCPLFPRQGNTSVVLLNNTSHYAVVLCDRKAIVFNNTALKDALQLPYQ